MIAKKQDMHDSAENPKMRTRTAWPQDARTGAGTITPEVTGASH